RVADSVLNAQYVHATSGVVVFQRLFHRLVVPMRGQRDGIFQGPLGARSDRVVSGASGIARQYQMHFLAGAVIFPVHPLVADHAGETNPDGRTAQVRGIADELVAIEVIGKQLLAVGNGLFLRHFTNTGFLPGFLGRFHDERGQAFLETVGVSLEPAVLGFHKNEIKGVKHLFRTQPDKTAVAGVDIGLVHVLVTSTNGAVDTVRGNQDIGVVLTGQLSVVRHHGLEHQVNAHFLAASLQDVQQLFATNPDETMTAGAHGATFEMALDVVPVVEGVTDGLRGHRVSFTQVFHGGIREHHAPAKGVVRSVTLDHKNLVLRVLQLHQQTEIQAGWASANTYDIHDMSVWSEY